MAETMCKANSVIRAYILAEAGGVAADGNDNFMSTANPAPGPAPATASGVRGLPLSGKG